MYQYFFCDLVQRHYTICSTLSHRSPIDDAKPLPFSSSYRTQAIYSYKYNLLSNVECMHFQILMMLNYPHCCSLVSCWSDANLISVLRMSSSMLIILPF